jgi:hypothetical protein
MLDMLSSKTRFEHISDIQDTNLQSAINRRSSRSRSWI